MSEPEHPEPPPGAVLREACEAADLVEALEQALAAAGLTAPPEREDDFVQFLLGPFDAALVGRVHPATAAHLIASVREQVARVDESHMRVRADAHGEHEAITLPPPSSATALEESYEDLATGAIHTRATPVFGIRVASNAPGDRLWAIVSHEPSLVRAAQEAAPSDVDVVVASSMAVLKGALGRAAASGAILLDAEAPSIRLERAIEVLIEAGAEARVVLWRMDRAARERLHDRAPATRRWLPCDHEVTPAEIVRLLAL